MSKNPIYSITKFTTTDYKDHLSCVVWFHSCNMRCQYCYNPDIVKAKEGNHSLKELYSFLKQRVGLLDAVVLSGGEATNFNLITICEDITNLGFKVKLDTNGSNPALLKQLLENYLIDYVSLDFKATKSKFKDITKSNFYEEFIESLRLLIASKIEFEVRTTLHSELLNENDINEMIDVLIENGYKKEFYIQNFLEVENLGKIKTSKNSFDKKRLNKGLNLIFRD